MTSFETQRGRCIVNHDASGVWVYIGASGLLVISVGHLIFVDLSLLWWIGDFVDVVPDPDIIDALKQTTLSWGPFGHNVLGTIITGMSVWLSVSMAVMAFLGVLVFRATQPGESLRVHVAGILFAAMLVFALISAVCFVLPPTLGGIVGSFCFGSALRQELMLRAGHH